MVSISAIVVVPLMVPTGSFLVPVPQLSDEATVFGIMDTVAEATAPGVAVGIAVVVDDEVLVPILGTDVVPIGTGMVATILGELDESMEAIATEAAATDDNKDAAECWCLGGSCLL